MGRVLGVLAVGGLLVALVLFAASDYNESAASKADSRAAYMEAWGHAQAMIITAKGESWKDFSTAALPWAVLGIGLISGAVAIVYLVHATPPAATRIERQTVYYVGTNPPEVNHERDQVS